MDFEMLLWSAKQGDMASTEQIHRMYRPFLIKNAMEYGVFDEDLYQELCVVFIRCIRLFRI